MKTGDIVFHQEYGVGKIKFIDGLAYLVYYYKENPLLHNGFIGPNFHYWWSRWSYFYFPCRRAWADRLNGTNCGSGIFLICHLYQLFSHRS